MSGPYVYTYRARYFQTNPRTCKSRRDEIQERVYEILECAVLDVLFLVVSRARCEAEQASSACLSQNGYGSFDPQSCRKTRQDHADDDDDVCECKVQ